MTRAFAVIVVLLSALLAGCGWHLRGVGGGDLSDRAVLVESRLGAGPLTNQALSLLDAYGARVVETRAAAEQVLVILAERYEQRTLVTDENGDALEYELRYYLSFRVEGPEGEVLQSQQTVFTDGAYQADPLDAVGTQARRDRLAEELRFEAVQLMLARLARVQPRNQPDHPDSGVQPPSRAE